MTKGRVLIDPGHGGIDVGAVTHFPVELHESEINLAIAEKLSDLLTIAGYDACLTRQADVSVPLSHRAKFIDNVNPDIFISIHCNSSTNTAAHGTEIIYRDVEDKVLAECIQPELVTALGTKNRGVRSDLNYLKRKLAVLNNAPVPSCLIEVAFISNPTDAELLLETSKIAQAILRGIEQWVISRLDLI